MKARKKMVELVRACSSEYVTAIYQGKQTCQMEKISLRIINPETGVDLNKALVEGEFAEWEDLEGKDVQESGRAVPMENYIF
jgi:hypothetical protein